MQVANTPEPLIDGRFWQDDLRAAFVLFPMSIAFGLGIAQISGFPPMAGLVSAVIGMAALFFYKGSYIVICGSAAALAPILYGAVVELGQGDMVLGYQRTLTVILLTGPIMFLLGYMRWTGKVASLLSHAVVSGLLASIAIILVASRLTTFMGTEPLAAKEPFHKFVEVFTSGVLWQSDPMVLGTSLATFAFLSLLTVLQFRSATWGPFLKKYPPQLWAIFLVLILGLLVPLNEAHRVTIPENLTDFHLWPDFNFVAMWQEGVFWALVIAVVTLTAVDSAETVATVKGIDTLDPLKRESDVNRVVSAMGIANFLSGFLGGLSNIPGGAKSTMSASVGAKTRLVGGFSIIFVILAILFGRDVMNVLPQGGLAMIIVFTVAKMCAPKVWKHFWRAGPDQFAVFFTTFGVSVFTGHIEEGLIAGVLLQFAIVILLASYAAWKHTGDHMLQTVFKVVSRLWTGPEVFVEADPTTPGVYHVYISGIYAFCHPLDRVLEQVPREYQSVHFHIDEDTYLIDHESFERLRKMAEKLNGVVNLRDDILRPLSTHRECTRFRLPTGSVSGMA